MFALKRIQAVRPRNVSSPRHPFWGQIELAKSRLEKVPLDNIFLQTGALIDDRTNE